MYRDYTQQLNTIISLLRELISGQDSITESISSTGSGLNTITAILIFLAGSVAALIILKLWDWLEKKTRF